MRAGRLPSSLKRDSKPGQFIKGYGERESTLLGLTMQKVLESPLSYSGIQNEVT